MDTIDKIYIINLKKNYLRKYICIHQLNKFNITNYKIIEAIDSNKYNYKSIYNNIIKNMTPSFVNFNFRIGALGCLLSHIECIKDAIKNDYKQIIILEDDFLLKNDFLNEFNCFFNRLNSTHNNWDLVYLGKKQGNEKDKIENNPLIYLNKEYHNVVDINEFIYRPNYKTWGTHALMIKNTIFNEILSYETNIVGPIDLLMMSSYDKFNFYSIKNDLIISDESESDIMAKPNIDWGWDTSLYFNFRMNNIKNVVILGFYKDRYHTHSYIHEMYYNFFTYYYPELNVFWTDDEISKLNINEKETIVIISPCHMNIKFELPKFANYIIHLDEFDNIGYKNIDEFLNDNKNKEIIENKNYIILTCRNGLKGVNYFDSDINNRIICLPWFSNKLSNEIIKPDYDSLSKKKYISYIGSIWTLTIDMIIELINVCEKNEIHFLLKGRAFGISHHNFKFLKQLNDNYKYVKYVPFVYDSETNNENSFEFLDKNYGIKGILPLQGLQHNENYISNRIIETISNGHIIVTNNFIAKKHFKSAIYHEKIEDLIIDYYKILSNKEKFMNVYEEQYNELISKFYGYNIINKLLHFFKDVNLYEQKLLFLNYNKNTFKVIFRMYEFNNQYCLLVNNNNDLREAIKDNKNCVINLNNNKNFDYFLIEKIISMPNSLIYYDFNISNEFIKNIQKICNKYNKEFTVKNHLSNYCILSPQRSGSTLIIDFLQKCNKNYLALSEIFNEYETSFDITHNDGILKGIELRPFKQFQYIFPYFKQFLDYSYINDYDGFVFKLTFDLTHQYDEFYRLDEITEFIKTKCRIIYIERNIIDSYISKTFCKNHSYSNEIYSKTQDKMFSLEELYNFVESKNIYLSKFDIKFSFNILTYENIVKNINNYDASFINIPLSMLDKNLFKYIKLNEKQNNYEIKQLLNRRLWKI
jgi:GR25 family glycosyltransferase involved in LPS biosynthesis